MKCGEKRKNGRKNSGSFSINYILLIVSHKRRFNMPVRLTESYLRSVIRQELKEMAMVDPKTLDYQPVGTDKFDGVRAQIKQALDVISRTNLDRMPKISNAITELEGHLKMALKELEELQASEPFEDA